MRYEQILATVIISLLSGTIGAYLVSTGRDPLKTGPVAPPTAIEKVAQSGKLRCGYIVSEPGFTKSDSGAFGGIWYRATEAVAQRAKLEVVWTTATTAETLIADLKADKFDALCTGLTPDLALAKDVSFSTPAYKQADKPQSYAVPAKAVDLRDFLSLGLAALQREGEMETILQKFDNPAAPLQRVTMP